MSTREIKLPAGHVLKVSTLRPQAVVWRAETPADHMTATPGEPVSVGPFDGEVTYSVLGRADVSIVSRDGKPHPVPGADLSGKLSDIQQATAEALAVIADQKRELEAVRAELNELKGREAPIIPDNSEDLAALHDQINELKAERQQQDREFKEMAQEMAALKDRPPEIAAIPEPTREFILKTTDAKTDEEIIEQHTALLDRYNELTGLLMQNAATHEQIKKQEELHARLFPFAGGAK